MNLLSREFLKGVWNKVFPRKTPAEIKAERLVREADVLAEQAARALARDKARLNS